MKIMKLVIGMENLEAFSFERKEIGQFFMEGIHRTIQLDGQYLYCSDLSISLNRKANTKKNELNEGKLNEDGLLPFDRLKKCPDINDITIFYEDGSQEMINVPWEPTQQYDNPYQTTFQNEFGDLFIKISKNHSFKEFFKKEEITNEEKMNRLWKIRDENYD